MTDLRRTVVAAQAALRVAAAVPLLERTWVSRPRTVREWLHRIGRKDSAQRSRA